MPKMNIERSITVDKRPEEVYKIVSDFHHWQPWSPWLITEPDVKVDVREDGKYYKWTGDLTGEGEMTITREDENKSIDYDLTFLKPWKSHAKVGFVMKPEGEGTKVSWTMASSLPWFMFWMKKITVAMIGMDYERGLNLLKDYVEDGKVHSNLDFKGEGNKEACKYIGIQRNNVAGDKVGDAMKEDFTKLMTYAMDNHKDKIAGNSFTLYHKWDMVNGNSSFSSCVPMKEIPTDLPTGVIVRELPATKVHTVLHTGPYTHLGNAWSAQYSRQRAKRFKVNKAVDPIEEYLNSPQDTDPKELKSEIHIPIK